MCCADTSSGLGVSVATSALSSTRAHYFLSSLISLGTAPPSLDYSAFSSMTNLAVFQCCCAAECNQILSPSAVLLLDEQKENPIFSLPPSFSIQYKEMTLGDSPHVSPSPFLLSCRSPCGQGCVYFVCKAHHQHLENITGCFLAQNEKAMMRQYGMNTEGGDATRGQPRESNLTVQNHLPLQLISMH